MEIIPEYDQQVEQHRIDILNQYQQLESHNQINSFTTNFANELFKPTFYPEIQFTKLSPPTRDLLMPKLSGQWKEVIGYLQSKQYNKLNTELEIKDLENGISNKWLGDEIVNGFMQLITSKTIGFINSFFFTKLTKNWRLSEKEIDYENAKRWVRKIDIFSYNKVLVPINIRNTHWILSCINNDENTIDVYDSLGPAKQMYGNRLNIFMKKYCEEKGIIRDYIVRCLNCPQQHNGFDCGAFTCKAADCIRLDVEFDYSQDDMIEWRKLLVSQVILKKLIVTNDKVINE